MTCNLFPIRIRKDGDSNILEHKYEVVIRNFWSLPSNIVCNCRLCLDGKGIIVMICGHMAQPALFSWCYIWYSQILGSCILSMMCLLKGLAVSLESYWHSVGGALANFAGF